MGDNILQNTLPAMPGGMTVPGLKDQPIPKDYNEGIEKNQAVSAKNLKTLQGAQATPDQMAAFQKIMSATSQEAFKKRQVTDAAHLNKQFDPSKVSGGIFAGVLNKLTGERSQDTSKIYGANMGTYRNVQKEITRRIDYIQDLENKKAEYMIQYKYDKKAAEDLEHGKSTALKRLKAEKAQFNKEYIQGLLKAGSDTSYMDFSAAEIQQSIQAMADANHAYGAIEKALNLEGIPTIPGTTAGNYLSTLFNNPSA